MPFDKEVRINQEWDALAPKDWGVKKHADERAMLSGLLEADESLAGLVSGNFEFNGVIPRTNLGVATDRRLIFLRQTKRANEVVELPYATIESISSNIGLMGGVVKGSAGTKGRFEMLNIYPKHQAESFADTVQSLVTQMRERGIPAAEVAPPVSIERAEADGPGMVLVEDAVAEQLIVPTSEPASVTVGAGSRLDAEWNALAPADWGSKKHANERATLSDLLEAGEPLECLVSGDFAPAGALVGHSNLGVATDRRLIFLRQTKRANEVVSLPYDTIESISFKTGWQGGSVKVTSRHKGEYQMGMIQPKERAELFAETVQTHLTPVPERGFAATEPVPSVAVEVEPVPINETVPAAVEEAVSAATDDLVSVVVSKAGRFEQEWASLAPGLGHNKHVNERAMLEGLLDDSESLAGLVSGGIGFNGESTQTGLGVATDRRLIFLRQTKRADEVVSLPYDTIESCAGNTGLMGGGVKGSAGTKGRFEMVNIFPKQQAESFADTVQALITQMRERGIPASEVAPPEMVADAESRLDAEWNALAPADWDWGSKKHANERVMLNALLEDNERLKCLVGGSLSGTAVSSNTYLGVATDRRIVFLRKEKRSDEVVELPYSDISVIAHSSSFMRGTLKVSAQGKGRFEMNGIAPKEQAEAFVETVQPYIAAAQVGNPAKLCKEDRIDQEWAALIPKGWGTFGDKGMHSGEREMLYKLLEDDETLECLVGGKFGPDLGRSHIARDKSLHSGVGVATDRRVIFLDAGFLSAEVAELPYSSVETISYSLGMAMGGLKISARGATSLQMEMIKPMGQAKVFADAVRKRLNAGQTAAPTVVQTASAMDELEKAAALYERGLLTPEEFAAKKAQLLNS